MIGKVLVANRGEIVRRVIRACGDLGLRSVAVYSDADAGASYCRQADEAYGIGAANPMKSYLNVEALVAVIARSGADAVHPGYGFLSENADFAEAVEASGAVWVGPAPNVLRSIESKSHCRDIAIQAGVPVVPGSAGLVSDPEGVFEVAEHIRYPLLLKLDRGGGGKGIEMVRDANEVSKTLEKVQRIGLVAFGAPDLYVEMAVDRPRHIEVQFIADRSGNVVCLGERECSVQRRHQKIIEESPSPVVSPEQRAELTGYASRLARRMGYVGAGTMEFLRSASGDFCFMEVNARLQVEHPVSEFVSGEDIVQWQLRIAAGEDLSFTQDDVELTGHAIEARCYAESVPAFVPSPGVVSGLRLPVMGRRLRVEHALELGGSVPPFYDPLIAKVISWDTTREAAIARLTTALESFSVEGVATTIPLNRLILESDAFVRGDLHTGVLAEILAHEIDWTRYGVAPQAAS